MLLSILAILAGFGLLIWGADRFVMGASATARNLGVSPLIIGLTIVGFGTSAPEMLVSGLAAWYGNPGISVGNAIGSNITNIGLVLGITALIVPVTVNSDILRREFPLLFLFMMLALWLISDSYLGWWDGLILIGGMFAMIIWVVMIGMRSRKSDPMKAEFEEELSDTMSSGKATFWLIIGIVVLLVGSRAVVWGATEIAIALGISDLVIGLTIIAIGTSLPELAATIMCVYKNEHDIAIGNIVGSNMFNLLGVLGLPGLIHPFALPAETLSRDFGVMVVLTIALFIMSYGFKGAGRINRFEGGILLASWCGYMGWIYVASV